MTFAMTRLRSHVVDDTNRAFTNSVYLRFIVKILFRFTALKLSYIMDANKCYKR